MNEFRFENLDVWKNAITLSSKLFPLSEIAYKAGRFGLAKQLETATLSISNNISEGSGCDSDKEFARFLVISRRSLFECVNILYNYELVKLITSNTRKSLYPEMLFISKQLWALRTKLLNNKKPPNQKN